MRVGGADQRPVALGADAHDALQRVLGVLDGLLPPRESEQILAVGMGVTADQGDEPGRVVLLRAQAGGAGVVMRMLRAGEALPAPGMEH